MKPNGKTFVVRMMLFTMCAVCLLSDLSKAETVRGTFKLPVTAQWGGMMLSPGEYDFVVDTTTFGRMITVRSEQSGKVGMILANAVSQGGASSGSTLKLATSEGGTYVQMLYLNDAGIALQFSIPKPLAKLAKSSSSGVTSASGSH